MPPWLVSTFLHLLITTILAAIVVEVTTTPRVELIAFVSEPISEPQWDSKITQPVRISVSAAESSPHLNSDNLTVPGLEIQLDPAAVGGGKPASGSGGSGSGGGMTGKQVAVGARASWSPDGKRIVFGKMPFGTGLQVLEIESGKLTNITQTGKDPAWSSLSAGPIAYVRKHAAEEQIWLVSPDGTNDQKLADGGFPSWSFDGLTVYFHSRKAARIMASNLRELHLPPRFICDMHTTWYPVVSPNEKYVAYTAREQLLVMEIRTRRQLAAYPVVGWSGVLIGWSPDSTLVGFGSYGGRPNEGLSILDLATGKVVQITTGAHTLPAWSNDGTRLAYDVRTHADPHVFILETEALSRLLSKAPKSR